MGEESRGSSGGGTAMMVVAILGGILLVGCCGGVIVLGLGSSFIWVRSSAPNVQMQPPPAPVTTQLAPEVTKALDDLNKEMEPLKITPEEATPIAPLEPGSEKSDVAPPPGTEGSAAEAVPAVPGTEDKKE